ncbi:hypothetical protein P154DRAFT_526932 [Amniculicola lignicola CBS 123094]|uniref:Uncharacterized protein n=1 Tax=Amniculicola lignicola CBS 123094 TaxID=1392246 RepID=A0A6A5VYF1_9PLEO|nr:hypothetical protein P154DRAFT_526932 [Amniculicola lignicola CBS 123094]
MARGASCPFAVLLPSSRRPLAVLSPCSRAILSTIARPRSGGPAQPSAAVCPRDPESACQRAARLHTPASAGPLSSLCARSRLAVRRSTVQLAVRVSQGTALGAIQALANGSMSNGAADGSAGR